MFCLGVAVMWTAIRPSHEHGMPITAMVITGYVPLTMWRHCMMRGVKAYDSNGALLFHRQVTPLDIITARVALEVVGTLIAGLLVVVGAIVTGWMDPPQDVGLIYLGLLFHIGFCYATGLLIAALSQISDVVERSISVVSYLSLPFSGAFAMVDWLPEQFQKYVLWSPSVHNMEMIRAGQFGPGVHPHYSLVYDTWITLLLVLVGVSMTLRVRRHILVQ